MKILHVSSRDILGGAEGVALSLSDGQKALGHHVMLAVGLKTQNEESVYPILKVSRSDGLFRFVCWKAHRYAARFTRLKRVAQVFEFLARPKDSLDRQLGRQVVRSADCRALVAKLTPDIVHLHNLHGDYFDFDALSHWASATPIVLHLHDMWSFTGHCAYSLGCEGFRSGCKPCPDLTIPPAIKRDSAGWNLKHKVQRLNSTKPYVIAPSQWIHTLVEQSQLNSRLSRVIPNGTDVEVFSPGSRNEAREQLRLHTDAFVVGFSGRAVDQSPFKDFNTVKLAVEQLASCPTFRGRVVLMCIGSNQQSTWCGEGYQIVSLPFSNNLNDVAMRLRACDVYAHAAKAETFGKVVTEAMACGLPVVATEVGGIGEIVSCLHRSTPESATGVLVPAGDCVRLAQALLSLTPEIAERLGKNARKKVLSRFSLKAQIQSVMDFYHDALQDWQSSQGRH